MSAPLADIKASLDWVQQVYTILADDYAKRLEGKETKLSVDEIIRTMPGFGLVGDRLKTSYTELKSATLTEEMKLKAEIKDLENKLEYMTKRSGFSGPGSLSGVSDREKVVILRSYIAQAEEEIKYAKAKLKSMQKELDLPEILPTTYHGEAHYLGLRRLKEEIALLDKQLRPKYGEPDNDAYKNWQISVPRYKKSLRPVSQMGSMCKITLGESKLPRQTILALPVYRLKQLYNPTSDVEYCGTFYFTEPESNVLLILGQPALFGSKVHAAITFYRKLVELSHKFDSDDPTEVSIIKQLLENQWAIALGYATKENPREFDQLIQVTGTEDLKSIHDEDEYSSLDIIFKDDDKTKEVYRRILAPFYESIFTNESEVKQIPLLDTTSLYPSSGDSKYIVDNLVGYHDFLDQTICKWGRLLGVDTIILQHEVGEKRSVTEILDTREDSYSHLVRQPDVKEWWKSSDTYPTTWFAEYGFVTGDTCCNDFTVDPANVNKVRLSPQCVITS